MDHTTLRGAIVSWYEKKSNEGDRSREDFVITKHGDGSRVMRAFCQLYKDHIVRDVVLGIDSDYRTRNGYVRVMVNDAFQGSAWYDFTGESILCEADTADNGRQSKVIPAQDTLPVLGTHALQSDAWMLTQIDLSQGPGIQTLKNIPYCSSHLIGATGPDVEIISADVNYVGDEKLEVRAGTFDTHHFQFVTTSNDHPPFDLWTSADGDYLFVKGFVGGDWAVSYELVSLERQG